MPSSKLALPDEAIDDMIREIRGVRVILDSNLAALYGVTTKRLNEQFKRNRKRFPEDFAFQLTSEEADSLRSQNATASSSKKPNWSQFATSSSKHRGRTYRPWAFTEHGALQAANVLNSTRAVQMSVFVIRAFAKMRETLLGTRELAKKLAALEKQLTGRLDSHEAAIVHVLQDLMLILNPPSAPLPPPKPRIGLRPDLPLASRIRTSPLPSLDHQSSILARMLPPCRLSSSRLDTRTPAPIPFERQRSRVSRQSGYRLQPQKSDPARAPRFAVRFTIVALHDGQWGAVVETLTFWLTPGA